MVASAGRGLALPQALIEALEGHMGEVVLAFPADAAAGPPPDAYRDLIERLATLKSPCFWPAGPGQPPLGKAERIGLIRLLEAIPAGCGEEKMLAVIEAMRHAPAGDVVEIGSGWGRSAALLVWLARRYDIGRVLCVDAWADDEALGVFEINLAPFAGGAANYLRARPDQAAKLYAAGLRVRTEAFGETAYQGQIAFLHVGASGAGPEAARDCALWTSAVVPGGWICFDVCEAAGDARRRVADAFVVRNETRVSTHFEAGGSLFIQLKR
jgi:hypothetical protein